MAYIGLPPKANFTSGLLDRFTSTTGTTVTLTHDISSENDIVVFVNFVKQDSTTYSVGGTGNKTLTLGGTLVSSDIVEVHYLNIVGQTVNPSANSVGSSQLTADVITGQTALAVAPDSTDELLISDAGTLKRVDVSLVGGNNTPAFSVIMSADQTGISDNVETKVDFDTEEYDTNSSYDVSNQRFTVPSGSAGKYQFSACVSMSGTNCGVNNVKLYKNGSAIRWSRHNHIGGDAMDDVAINLVCTLDLSESDYIEIYAYSNVTSGTVSFLSDSSSNERSYFSGFKLIT